MLLFEIYFIFGLVGILFSVMFITLLERKILSLTQNRLGPNKISLFGLLQPLLDGMKLFLKEKIFFQFINKSIFFIGPWLFLFLMILIWISIPFIFKTFDFSFSLAYFLVCIGLGVYATLVSGWSSNSKFSVLGSIRSMAQTISYEISLSILFFSFFVLISSISLQSMIKTSPAGLVLIILPGIIIWVLSMVAETNRAPFDFAEGESELVSGFNTEFSSSLFAFLFIGEYGMIIFFSILTSFIFFFFGLIEFFMVCFFFLSLKILIRSVYPRFRYDKLMNMAWFKFLPVVISFILFSTWLF